MRPVRTAAITLLTFLGITALAGAVPMILYPRGSAMMPLSLLEHSPFRSFLIPGLVLFTANGLLALWVLRLVLARKRHYGLWVALQGSVLLIWLIVECWMLRAVVWLHYLYGAVAVALIVTGFVLRRLPTTDRTQERQSAPESSARNRAE